MLEIKNYSFVNLIVLLFKLYTFMLFVSSFLVKLED